jgi:hypothetical protein
MASVLSANRRLVLLISTKAFGLAFLYPMQKPTRSKEEFSNINAIKGMMTSNN